MLIPVNFLLSFVCLLLLVKKYRAGGVFRLLLLLCLAHSIIAGLSVLPPFHAWHLWQPVTAAALPLVCLMALRQATGNAVHYAIGIVGVLLMASCVLWLPAAIDWLMPLIWLASAGAMLFKLRRGRDRLTQLALEESALTLNGWRLLAGGLVVIALIDIRISWQVNAGMHQEVEALLLGGNLLVSILMALALLLAPAQAAPQLEKSPRQISDMAGEVMERIDALMRSGLHRESGLNLAMLARKCGIPARQVSAAINSLHQQNVSQYVNGWRIADACDRLCYSQHSIIDIMESVGFQTKSNFNREFRRITGKTPSAWRAECWEQAEIGGNSPPSAR